MENTQWNEIDYYRLDHQEDIRLGRQPVNSAWRQSECQVIDYLQKLWGPETLQPDFSVLNDCFSGGLIFALKNNTQV